MKCVIREVTVFLERHYFNNKNNINHRFIGMKVKNRKVKVTHHEVKNSKGVVSFLKRNKLLIAEVVTEKSYFKQLLFFTILKIFILKQPLLL